MFARRHFTTPKIFASSLLAGMVSLALNARIACAAVSSTPAIAKPGGGQQGLAVAFTPEGQLRAGVCAAEPCNLDHAVTIPVPEEAARAASGAKLQIVRLGTDRKAVVVEIPEPTAQRTWSAVLAAPLAGPSPLVPFSGYTGFTEGTEDERSGPMVLVRDGAVYVGTQKAGYELCGRPAILAPRVLDPKTLTLKPAKVQRLDEAERDAAPVLEARLTEAPPSPELLHAVWATSAAAGAPASALTDGKLETMWAEGRGGTGRGELAVLGAPREVPIGAFEIALPARKAPHAAVPRDVWLVTDRQVFHVNIPEPRAAEGARYEVALPAPVSTSCVALVLDGAATEDADANVAVAELGARPATAASLDEMVHALAGGGEGAEAAGAVLRVSGPDAQARVAAAFAELDEGGRRVALDVLDDAPCAVAEPVYVAALVGPFEAQRLHARRALDRCPADAAAAFEAAIAKGTLKDRIALADELSSVAPATAVAVLVPRLAKAGPSERRSYRGAIGRAAEASDARANVVAALERTDFRPVVVVDLLRALGANLPSFGDSARRAFFRVLTPQATFRTRFLLLEPATELSSIDATAKAYVERALTTEPDARIRAEAALSLRDPRPYRVELSRLLDDPAVRVREAAVTALGVARADDARDRMLWVMQHDAWPFVRIAAAHGVAGLAAGHAVDESLAQALENDESPDVRRAAIRGIGERRATADVGVVRERFADDQELPGVRAEAAVSLGLLCDVKSVATLTGYAQKLSSPTTEEVDRLLGKSALTALALIHPPDFEQRLAPLRDKKSPAPVRLFALAALHTPSRCPRLPAPHISPPTSIPSSSSARPPAAPPPASAVPAPAAAPALPPAPPPARAPAPVSPRP